MHLYRVTSPGAFVTSFFAALIVMLGIANPSGQAAPDGPQWIAHLEKYEDAPMYIFRHEESAQMISQQGAFTSFQVNGSAGGQNTPGDAANEPSITVDPTNRTKMSVGWRQFD